MGAPQHGHPNKAVLDAISQVITLEDLGAKANDNPYNHDRYTNADARAAAPILIDPLAIGGASYDTTDDYAYLAFPAASTEVFRLLTIRDPSSLTVYMTNASGAETGDARIEVSIDGGSTYSGQDVTFTAGGSASATFDLSSASGAVEVLIRRDHDHANDDLAAEVELTDGRVY